MSRRRLTPFRYVLGASALLLALLGCSAGQEEHAAVPVGTTPEVISGWNLVRVADGEFTLLGDALPYDLNTPLFSDYAHKLRTVWVPEGKKAHYTKAGDIEFPVGTVFTKTFYYPEKNGRLMKSGDPFSEEKLRLEDVRLIETRVLVRRESGWEGLPYVWNAEQTEAHLAIAGDIKELSLGGDEHFNSFSSFKYVIPTKNECASCHATNHTTAELQPIGPKVRHLNKMFVDYKSRPADQLSTWEARGLIDGLPEGELPRAAGWPPNERDSLDAQARSYLDINCGHCHSPVGPADTSGMFLHAGETSMRRLGVCKPPIAAGRGSGGRDISIHPGDRDKSILYFRMESRDPAAMMPEIGRSLVHEEGLAVVGAWIDAMDRKCGMEPSKKVNSVKSLNSAD